MTVILIKVLGTLVLSLLITCMVGLITVDSDLVQLICKVAVIIHMLLLVILGIVAIWTVGY